MIITGQQPYNIASTLKGYLWTCGYATDPVHRLEAIAKRL